MTEQRNAAKPLVDEGLVKEALKAFNPHVKFPSDDLNAFNVTVVAEKNGWKIEMWSVDNGQGAPTDLNALVESHIEQKTANAYQKQRAAAYPPMSELADALFWKNYGDNTKMAEYLKKCAAVKKAFPKPV